MTAGVVGQLHILSPLRFCLFMLSPTNERWWGGLGEVIWYTVIEPKIKVGAHCKQGVFIPAAGPGVACEFCVGAQTSPSSPFSGHDTHRTRVAALQPKPPWVLSELHSCHAPIHGL